MNREIGFTNYPAHYLSKTIEHVGYTFLDVTFEIPKPSPVGDKDRLGRIADEGIRVAQHFVDVYREVSNESDVFHPTIEDSPGIEIFLAENYTFTEDGVDAAFRRVSRQIRWELEHVTGRTKDELSIEKVIQLEQKLREDYDPPVHIELLLDAKDSSIIDRNHRMAIVTVETAFEAFVQQRLLAECEIRGISSLVGRGRNTTEKDYREAIESGNIKADLLGTYCSFLCGKSVRAGSEYQRWYDDTYNPRNDIIHRGKRTTSEDDAEKAFVAVVNYMNFLERELVRSRPT